MARCDVCGKGTTVGRRISINRSQVSKRAKRQVKPNIQRVRLSNENGQTLKINICTNCLRSLKAGKLKYDA